MFLNPPRHTTIFIYQKSSREAMANVLDDDIRQVEERLFSDDVIEKAKPKEYKVEKEEKKSFFGKKQKIELKPEPRVTIKQPTPGSSEPKKEVTFSFYPNRIMRGVLIFLFLFFAVSFFYNPFYTFFPWNIGGAEGNIVGVAVGKGIALAAPPVAETGQPVAPETPKETTPAPLPEQSPLPAENKETTPEEPAANEEPANATAATGDVTLTLEDIKTVTRDWGGKITDVSFIVENRGKTFIPKIKAYAFDAKTSADYKTMPIIKKYAALGKDKQLTATIDLSRFQFTDTGTEKTLILQLYDEGDEIGFANDEKRAEIETKVTIK